MSNKRLKRTEAEFFVYEPGVVVPRDVTHILVPPGVEVLPPGAFRDLRLLREIRLSEGLKRIAWRALRDCRSLECINFPSTLVTICRISFYCCSSLSTLHFPEGLTEIGIGAFRECSSLTRISVSSTVTMIDDHAFQGLSSLEVVTLVDGIRTIGYRAFSGCPLTGMVLPATLTRIGSKAFGSCQSLRRVSSSAGIQIIKENAFDECHLLDCVRVTSNCLIVTITEYRNNWPNEFDFKLATHGTIAPHSEFDRVVIASECFHSMSAAELSSFEIAVTDILRMQLEWGDKHERLRTLLDPHERRRKEEVTAILELGLWKAEIRRSGGTVLGACILANQQAQYPDLGTRVACRMTCKAGGIIPNIVPFL